MAGKNFYDILNVPRDISLEGVSAAFRAMALRYHPDKVLHLDEGGRLRALRRMQAASEAFSTLRSAEARALYDRCLRERLDFALERWNLRSPFGDDERTDQAHPPTAPPGADVDRVVSAVRALPGMGNCSASRDDDYFDCVLKGLFRANRYLIHVKGLDSVGVEDLIGIMNFADGVGDLPGAFLSKAYHSYVVVARILNDAESVKATIEQYNARMSRTRRGEPVRGFVMMTGLAGEPYVPFAEYLSPAFRSLGLSPD